MAVKLLKNEKVLFEEAKEFALTKIAPCAEQWEIGKKKSSEAMDVFVENGYCSIGVSKEIGGKGYNFLECALIYEGLAHGDGALSSSVIQLHNNIVYMLSKFYHKNETIRNIFPNIVCGQKKLAFAITEKHSGSDPSSMKTYAELRHDGYHVYGAKSWIFNALEADHFVITVKDGAPEAKKMIMLLVDRKTPGMSIGKNTHRLGNNCISCCDIYFDDCIINKNRLITKNGFREALSFMNLPRIFVSSIAIGMSQHIIDITNNHFIDLKAFEISKKPNEWMRWTLFELLAQVEAGRWMVYMTASKMDKNDSIKIQAAMSKLFATEVAMETITRCLQLFGEKDCDKLFLLNRYMSVAKLLQIVDGTSEIQKIIIGRDLENKAKEQNAYQ
jgi:butyryl-CoA dehydrogenase